MDTSTHTSARERITATQAEPEALARPLRPVIGAPLRALSLSIAEYLRVLDRMPNRRFQPTSRSPRLRRTSPPAAEARSQA